MGTDIQQGYDINIERDGNPIPIAVWAPAGDGVRPLVLLGHGGSGHKRNERMTMLGERFANEHGWVAIAIDGPVHGARGPVQNATDPAYREMWQREDPVADMIADWQAVLDAALDGTLSTAIDAALAVDPARIGYWGLSMGTMFGLPFVAREPRIRAAVLGKAGMTGTSVARSGIDRYFPIYASDVTVPVLFTIQWDDERFERAGQLDLYDRLGSVDKRLHAYPGEHVDNGPDAIDTQIAFLRRYIE